MSSAWPHVLITVNDLRAVTNSQSKPVVFADDKGVIIAHLMFVCF